MPENQRDIIVDKIKILESELDSTLFSLSFMSIEEIETSCGTLMAFGDVLDGMSAIEPTYQQLKTFMADLVLKIMQEKTKLKRTPTHQQRGYVAGLVLLKEIFEEVLDA